MKSVNLEWFENNHASRLFIIEDCTGNSLIKIHIEVDRIIHTNGDEITIEFGDVDVSSVCDIVNLLKYHKDMPTECNENLFYEYIEHFSSISVWKKTIYDPKWKDSLGDEYYDAVCRFIENELYLFCCSFDNTVSYECLVNDEKRYIYENR